MGAFDKKRGRRLDVDLAFDIFDQQGRCDAAVSARVVDSVRTSSQSRYALGVKQREPHDMRRFVKFLRVNDQ